MGFRQTPTMSTMYEISIVIRKQIGKCKGHSFQLLCLRAQNRIAMRPQFKSAATFYTQTLYSVVASQCTPRICEDEASKQKCMEKLKKQKTKNQN